ncbi:hypothetical protein, partial [Kocuria rosea]|uniref:hypothetical protein n=1 Tax=Kocuria rosea TaxID=1275 RepID=UPI001643F9D3
VSAQEGDQVVLGDGSQDGRVGDVVAVEVEDGEEGVEGEVGEEVGEVEGDVVEQQGVAGGEVVGVEVGGLRRRVGKVGVVVGLGGVVGGLV